MTTTQVKVGWYVTVCHSVSCTMYNLWVKKKNYRRNHAKPQAKVAPVFKKKKLSVWQVFLKEYAETVVRTSHYLYNSIAPLYLVRCFYLM